MIPVCLPKLPSAEKLLPYLHKIETNRFYTNYGPLVTELEQRIADIVKCDKTGVQTFSSGAGALEAAIYALDPEPGGVALTPSWTFVATAHAAFRMGIEPYFIDIDQNGWAITPQQCHDFMVLNPDVTVSLVIAVAPFGKPLPIKEWEDFSLATDIPVLIDGAAMRLQDVQPSAIVPVMVSMHATKYIPAGEGGVVIWKNSEALNFAKMFSGFGINTDDITDCGTNYKMSEYHAAVALASLDKMEEIEADYLRVSECYKKHEIDIFDAPPNSFILMKAENLNEPALHAEGIGTRRWWRSGCHKTEYYQDAQKTLLPRTEKLAPKVTGLPCYRDLTNEQIDIICKKVIEIHNV